MSTAWDICYNLEQSEQIFAPMCVVDEQIIKAANIHNTSSFYAENNAISPS